MCQDVAQQGEDKGRSKELIEQANSPDFSFFPEFFSRIFPKGTSRKQTFLFFYYFLYTFLWTRITKDATTKIGTYNWGGMWSIEIQHVLWKACKNFDNFFSIFSRIFLAILMKPNKVKRVWVGPKWCQEAAEKHSDFSDKRAKSYACFTEGISRYVFWEAQHGGGS